jgi:hypothetical protein
MSEWEKEPDRKNFEYRGYSCIIKRNPLFFLCGYVAIPDFNENEDEYLLENVFPHGGITFSEYPCGNYLPLYNSIGQKLYWVGFDCAHASDMVPGWMGIQNMDRMIYRNMAYVEKEIKNMVDQIIVNIQNHGG